MTTFGEFDELTLRLVLIRTGDDLRIVRQLHYSGHSYQLGHGNGASGIFISQGRDHQIGGLVAGYGNVISGNALAGVEINGTNSKLNLVQGNIIGLNAAGDAKIQNDNQGLVIANGSTQNTIGSTNVLGRNIISGNNDSGVVIDGSGTSDNTVLGNYIGTNLAGNGKIANGINGITISGGATLNTIGGTTAAARNIISGNTVNGVQINSVGTSSNRILGNYIGTDTAGGAALGNGTGVQILSGASNNIIGGGAVGAGNVISGNTTGLAISGDTDAASGNKVQGNFFGTNAAGSSSLPNGSYDAIIAYNAATNIIGTDSDGSNDAGERNVFGGSGTAAVFVQEFAGFTAPTGNVIAGNYLGLNATGTAALGTYTRNIWLWGGNATRIGSNADDTNDTGERNIIVPGTNRVGVLLTDGAVNTTIAGNYIGTNPAGTSAFAGAGSIGVQLDPGANNNTIGGTSAAARNVISGNNTAVGIGSNVNLVVNNYIGLAADGLAALPNTEGGVFLSGTAASNQIGGSAIGLGNYISGNTRYGIAVTSSGTNNKVQGNVIGLNTADQIRGNGTAGILNNGGAGLTIGGTTAAVDRNVISGNPNGVWLVASANNTILGNYIGTDSTGTAARGNTDGIFVDVGSANNTIGGTTATARNVISSNAGDGININVGTTGTVIQGNFIGTASDGTTALGNIGDGIRTGSPVQIGGLTATPGTGAGNVISGNGNNVLNNAGNVYIGGATGVVIQGNIIGLDKTGTNVIRQTTQYGVWNFLGDNTTIGGVTTTARNIISGNGAYGLLLQEGSGLLVQNNYIGTDITGNLDRGNTIYGISTDTKNSTLRGNVVSGNDAVGIEISASLPTSASNISVVGNIIGLNAAGTAKLANTNSGLQLAGATNITIGGTTAADRNIISGNGGSGLSISGTGFTSTGIVIQGNYIGLGTDGVTALGNPSGLTIAGDVSGTVIGGTAAGAGNVISGNAGQGILLDGATTVGTLLQGNFIGTDKTGAGALGNATGIQISGGASNNTIGGTIAAARNIISGNNAEAIFIVDAGTNDNVIRGNVIGLDVAGDILGNTSGIIISIDAKGTIVGGSLANSSNVISGNSSSGLFIQGAIDTVVSNNFIGTDSTGLIEKANGYGVFISGPSTNTVIGSAGFAFPNVISGNQIGGVTINGAQTGTIIDSNYIGVSQGGQQALGNTGDGIRLIGSSGNTIRGNIIGSNTDRGISLTGANSKNNLIVGNSIGVAKDGSTVRANGTSGILLTSGANLNTIGGTSALARNIISGNTSSGIELTGATTTGNTVQGNYLGTDASGTARVQNGYSGVYINGAPNTTVGGSAPGAGNLASGNQFYGIVVNGSTATGAVIQGNRVGTNAAGNDVIPNIDSGIIVAGFASGALIGGTALGAGNLVSGNGPANVGSGINLYGNSVFNNIVQGNLIGTDVTGNAKLGSQPIGIRINGYNNTIGGGTLEAANVVSGNQVGIDISNLGADGNVIQGNRIGTNLAGTVAIGSSIAGVRIQNQAKNNTIGGTTASARNLISGNDQQGVLISSAGTGNKVQGNYVGTTADGLSALGNKSNGISVNASPSTTIRSNVVSGNGTLGLGGSGINIGAGSNNSVIAGNIIGLGADGDTPLPNINGGFGSFSNDITFGGPALTDRNIVSGNRDGGAYFFGNNITVQNNYIGTDITGTKARGNTGGGSGFGVVGLYLQSISNVTVDNNVISANAGSGVVVSGTSSNTVFINNKIGTNAAGDAPLGNIAGIALVSPATIGRPGQGNLISGNFGNTGIGLKPTASGSVIQGNKIGTNWAGTAAVGNVGGSGYGIFLDRTTSVQIGGGGAGEGNLISGNTYGIGLSYVGNDGNRVQGNLIGTQADGISPLGNSNYGIWLSTNVAGSVSNNVIGAPLGSTNTALGNTVAFNGKGVVVDQDIALGNTIRLNKLYSNPAANFSNSFASPAAPNINLAVANPTFTRVRGTISGTVGETITVDFYTGNVNETAARSYLGTAILTIVAGGVANFDTNFSTIVPPGTTIVGISTNSAGTTAGFGNAYSLLAPINVSISAPLNLPEGTEATVTSRVTTDRQNALLSFSWSVEKLGTPGLYATGFDASLQFTPDDNGVYRVTLTVIDSVNNETITVQPPNIAVSNVAPQPAILNRDTNQVVLTSTISTNTILRLRGAATDPGPADQTSLIYQWYLNGQLVSTSLDYDFTAPTAGDYLLGVKVTDKDGGVASRAFPVLVTGSISAVILGLPSATPEGQPVTARVQVVGANDTTRLLYQWTVTKNGSVYYTASSTATIQLPQISFTPNDNGTYVTTLLLTDPATGASATASITTVVSNVSPAVSATLLTAQPALGSPVNLFATARDPGGISDPIAFTWSVRGPIGAPAIPSGSGANFNFTPTYPGVYFVTVRAADDDAGVGTDTRAIEIVAGTRTVDIGGIPTTPLVEGSSTPLTATVPNSAGVNFTYTWTVTRNGDPFDIRTGSGYTFNPLRSGLYTVAVTAVGSDNLVGISQASVNVLNAAPIALIAPLPSVVAEGSKLTLSSLSRDPGGVDAAVTSTWTITGPGITGQLTKVARSFDWVVPDNGVYTISLKANDIEQAFTTSSVTVQSFNVAPQVTIVDNGTTPALLAFKASVIEPSPIDRANLTYQWFLNGVAVANATASTFSTTQIGQVSVRVSDNVTQVVRSSAVQVLTAPGQYTVAPVVNVDQILVIGTDGNDTIDATNILIPVALYGGDGNDTLIGGRAFNILAAGTGTNTLIGGNAGNLFIGGGNDNAIGGTGDDTFRVHFSTVSLNAGQNGLDTIDLSAVPFGVKLDLRSSTGSPQVVNAAASPGSTLALTGVFEQLIGTNKRDELTASTGVTINGGGGGDILRAAGSNVTLIGGSTDSSDTLIVDPNANAVTLIGSEFNSSFNISGTNTTLVGGSGNDTVLIDSTGVGALIQTGLGNDSITLNADFSTLVGGSGNDIITANTNNSIIIGSDGTLDPLNNPILTSDGGFNQITLNGNNSTLVGGDGNDILILTNGQNAVIQGGDGNDKLTGLNGSLPIFQGGLGNDTLTLINSTNATLVGGDGNDKIDVLGGTLPFISGGAGQDSMLVSLNTNFATLVGGSGNDSITINPIGPISVSDGSTVPGGGSGGNFFVDAGEGIDFLNLLVGSSTTLVGGSGNDIILDQGGKDALIYGGVDNDTIVISGLSNNSTLIGGEGNDTIIANPIEPISLSGPLGPVNILPSLTGADFVTLVGGSGNDTIIGGFGNGLSLDGGDNQDTLTLIATTNSTLVGGSGNDTFILGVPAVSPSGPTGSLVLGGDNNSTFEVNLGSFTTLIGGSGNDIINIDGGVGTLGSGGLGNDLFTVTGGNQHHAGWRQWQRYCNHLERRWYPI